MTPAHEESWASCPTAQGRDRRRATTWLRAWRGSAQTPPTGGPLWSAAPGVPGTAWGPLDPRGRGDSNFVQRLQEYGGLEVQRFLDLDWAKLVHSVTKHIFSGPDHQGALLTRRRPVPPIGYGEARDYLIRRYGHLPEGRGREEFGSSLANYVNTEISARADTCHDNVHYKAIDNGRWYILGRYVEPPPGQYPCLPADNSDGRNQAGNVYEALVGLY